MNTCFRMAVAAGTAVLALMGGAALAAGQVTAVLFKPLSLYAQPQDVTPVTTSDGRGLPWPLLEVRGEFYRVQINGKEYWIDSMQVQAERDSLARCGPVIGLIPEPPGAIPGAGKKVCR